MKLIKEINEGKENEQLKEITIDNLEEECRELIRLGYDERALKMVKNFSDDEIDKNPKFVNLKMELLWSIGMYQEWEEYGKKILVTYADREVLKDDPEVHDVITLKIFLINNYPKE